MDQGQLWGLTGLGVFALAGAITWGTCAFDWLTRRADRAQDRRKGWTEPPSRLDRLDGVGVDPWLP